MLLVVATCAKLGPNLLSLSRSRYLGLSPYGVASRTCWATQLSVGDRVTPHVDDLPRRELDDEEGKERTEEQIGDLQEITRPHTFRMSAQKGRPGLSSWSRATSLPHVLLDGVLAHMYAQLELFTANAFSSPQSIILGHVFD